MISSLLCDLAASKNPMSESALKNWALEASISMVNEQIIPQNARVKKVKKTNLFFMVVLFCCKVG